MSNFMRVSKATIQTYQQIIAQQFKEMRSQLDGTNFTDLTNKINKKWTGPAANEFIRDLLNTKNQVKTDLTKLEEQVKQTLMNDYNTFMRQQETNYQQHIK